jgi:hypothetical protein
MAPGDRSHSGNIVVCLFCRGQRLGGGRLRYHSSHRGCRSELDGV